jgi:hypothetical protein
MNRKNLKLIAGFVVAGALMLLLTAQVCGDALERLKAERLEAMHKDIAALKSQRHEVARTDPYRDYRANLHVHSAFSHDSRGKIDEIVAAAKAVGTQVLMFNEHPADTYDFFKDGHQGTRDGVLLIPGAESKGFLVFPTQSVRGLDGSAPQEFADLVRGRGGLMFLSHLEERMDWQIQGLTGVEVYNTHADFKDEKNLVAAMRNPLWLVSSADLFRKYPQEAFSALLDYPADYLRRWDELCERAPHTGVSANDAHQNVGLTIRLLEGNRAQLEDGLGKKLFEIDAGSNAALAPLLTDKKAGDALFELRLDRYEHSLRHVGTHLLMNKLTKDSVWEALEAGRAFVAFDWLADATGFDFAAFSGSDRHEMGSRVPFKNDLRFRARSPLNAEWKLIRNGKVVSESKGSNLDQPVTEPGNYRIEVWLPIAGEKTIWILSNPIYVQAE